MSISGTHEALSTTPPSPRPGTDESGPFEVQPTDADPFEAESDSAETNPVERVEHTPLPLPPTPAQEVVDGWIADSPTHPGAQVVDDGLITSTRRPEGSDDWPLEAESRPPPRPPLQWKIPAMVGVLCLVIGLLAGAFFF